MSKNYLELQDIIGYAFKDKTLLKRALSHSSYINERALPRSQCNERIEFLGDAVLELISSEFLFNEYGEDVNEGELTKLRAGIVCEPALADDARKIGLNKYLLLGKGEEQTGGRDRDSIISDAAEALIGAIYLDGGIEEARRFILNFVLDDIANKKLISDSKSELQEITQRRFGAAPEYRIISESGPSHRKMFVAQVLLFGKVLGEGEGRTKKYAEQKASYSALQNLGAGR